jgi:hypothetical protein
VRLTGVFMTLYALVACRQGRQVPLAAPVLSYNGSHRSSAVIGEQMALTPTLSGTIGHYMVSPLCRRASHSMSKLGSYPVPRRRPVGRRLIW